MAMEGPTPVSALIHAATMVTAGVYLLMRCSPLIEYSSTVLILCLWLGAITTVFSSLVGLFQQDIKKVIAYSTMSQLAREHNDMFRHQTICVEGGKLYSILHNSQITKAHKYYYIYISNSFLNSFINSYWLFSLYYNETEKWKVIIVSKLVGISEAIRLILTNLYYYNVNRLSLNLTLKKNFSMNPINNNEIKFNEWLAGLIDGDGYFSLSKKGAARLIITMDIRDKKALFEIVHKFGGSINKIANANALRYNLSNKKGLVSLINAVNGNIRNPTRMLQLNKFCIKYHIVLIYPKPLSFHNGWLSGFIDSDGSVYFNEESGQVYISASQKNIYLLEPLVKIYGGRVDPHSSKIDAFKYVVYRKQELFNLIDNYFSIYPLKSMKLNRLHLIKQFYLLRIYKNGQNIEKFNQWINFKNKWEKYQG